jgi:hypothetical protein
MEMSPFTLMDKAINSGLIEASSGDSPGTADHLGLWKQTLGAPWVQKLVRRINFIITKPCILEVYKKIGGK